MKMWDSLFLICFQKCLITLTYISKVFLKCVFCLGAGYQDSEGEDRNAIRR